MSLNLHAFVVYVNNNLCEVPVLYFEVLTKQNTTTVTPASDNTR